MNYRLFSDVTIAKINACAKPLKAKSRPDVPVRIKLSKVTSMTEANVLIKSPLKIPLDRLRYLLNTFIDSGWIVAGCKYELDSISYIDSQVSLQFYGRGTFPIVLLRSFAVEYLIDWDTVCSSCTITTHECSVFDCSGLEPLETNVYNHPLQDIELKLVDYGKVQYENDIIRLLTFGETKDASLTATTFIETTNIVRDVIVSINSLPDNYRVDYTNKDGLIGSTKLNGNPIRLNFEYSFMKTIPTRGWLIKVNKMIKKPTILLTHTSWKLDPKSIAFVAKHLGMGPSRHIE